jgi:hypothetical protein
MKRFFYSCLTVTLALMLSIVLIVPAMANGIEAYDYFGYCVSIDGDSLIVGADRDNDNGSDSGAAYVFIRDGDGWTEQAKLTPSDGEQKEQFGHSVAISGDTAVVGAYRDDDNGIFSGSAYVFVRSGTTWSQQAKLTASDAAARDYFGVRVDIEGDTIAVSAYKSDGGETDSGAIYVFERDGTAWSEQAKLTASDATAYDGLGVGLSISGNTIVAGATSASYDGNASGAAYVFINNGSSWTEQAKIGPSDGEADDRFGATVSLDGDTVLVSSTNDDDNGETSGAAYVFERSGGSWSQQAKLVASDASAYDAFGSGVSLEGDTAVIGAYGDDDNGYRSGSVYVFVDSGGSWIEQAKILASDGAAYDQFGSYLDISGETIVITALGDGEYSGSAYIYDTSIEAPAGWNNGNGNKTGWDGDAPPGLDKQGKTPAGFEQGKKTGWSKK